MEVSDLRPAKVNPRKIKDSKLALLEKAMQRFGDLGGFVFNRRSQTIVGGHQRGKIFGRSKVTIEKRFDPPTAVGTVAEGFIEYNGERWKYREVDWDEATEKAANIAANNSAGEFDLKGLTGLMHDLSKYNFDLNYTMFDVEERVKLLGTDKALTPDLNFYTKKIRAPIYEPKGDKPEPKQLCDRKKTRELQKEIKEANLPDEVRSFLMFAAERHTVFDYAKIAEYYAHAPKKIQELMESSALVIIDFDKAIEDGFLELTNDLVEAYKNDQPQA